MRIGIDLGGTKIDAVALRNRVLTAAGEYARMKFRRSDLAAFFEARAERRGGLAALAQVPFPSRQAPSKAQPARFESGYADGSAGVAILGHCRVGYCRGALALALAFARE